MFMLMLCVHVHAACPCPCTCCMSMSMPNIHAPCPCPCCISMTILHVHVYSAYWCPCCMSLSTLHVPIHAAGPCPYYMLMSILHVSVMFMLLVPVHVYATRPCPFCQNACPCCMSQWMDMDKQHRNGYAAWTWTFSMYQGMQHGHEYAALTWTCSIDTDMQPGCEHAAFTLDWTCSMYLSTLHFYVHGACPCPWCMFMSMLHAFLPHANYRKRYTVFNCPTASNYFTKKFFIPSSLRYLEVSTNFFFFTSIFSQSWTYYFTALWYSDVLGYIHSVLFDLFTVFN